MLDGAAVDLHLVHDRFEVGSDDVRVLAIEAVHFLDERQPFELVPIDTEELLPLQFGYALQAEIDELELRCEQIDDDERDKADVRGYCRDERSDDITFAKPFTVLGDDEVCHAHRRCQ